MSSTYEKLNYKMTQLPNPSDEQLKIISCHDSNIIINSVAGSGKTTTILHFVKSLKLVNSNIKALLLTYNKMPLLDVFIIECRVAFAVVKLP
jgi:superfamily I DNA and RNA helicase